MKQNDDYEQSLLARYNDAKENSDLSLEEFKQLTDYLIRQLNQSENGKVKAHQVYRAFRQYMTEDLQIDKLTMRDWIRSSLSIEKLLAEVDFKQSLDIMLHKHLQAVVGTTRDLERYIEKQVNDIIYDTVYNAARDKLKQATINVSVDATTKQA